MGTRGERARGAASSVGGDGGTTARADCKQAEICHCALGIQGRRTKVGGKEQARASRGQAAAREGSSSQPLRPAPAARASGAHVTAWDVVRANRAAPARLLDKTWCGYGAISLPRAPRLAELMDAFFFSLSLFSWGGGLSARFGRLSALGRQG